MNIPATDNFDWLSEPQTAFSACASWADGTYNELEIKQIMFQPSGPFYIAAGMNLLAEHLRRFRFTPEVIQRMGHWTDANGRSVLPESFLNYLQRMRLNYSVSAPEEGRLMLSGQPLLLLKGPKIALLLLESALQHLCITSTFWATQAAYHRWERQSWQEMDALPLPLVAANPEGWMARAYYLGGGQENVSGKMELEPIQYQPAPSHNNSPLSQIRRLYKNETPVGDLWLSHASEQLTEVNQNHQILINFLTKERKYLQFNRFQNLYNPLVLGGSAVLPTQGLAYLRQRTLKQLEYFAQINWDDYPGGWISD
ncbi:MAG: hypothetical protein KGS48_03915 [Bacteroidetes bacterium]|nr:hypothetical protein [Bacteroidota bacterium]